MGMREPLEMNSADGCVGMEVYSTRNKMKAPDRGMPLREPSRPQFLSWPLSLRQARAFRLGCAGGASLSLLLALLILGSAPGGRLGHKSPLRAAPQKLSRLSHRLRLSLKLQTRPSPDQAALATQEAFVGLDALTGTPELVPSHRKEPPGGRTPTQALGVHPALGAFLSLASAEEMRALSISRAAAATMGKKPSTPVPPKKPKQEASGGALISLAVHLPALAQPMGSKAQAKAQAQAATRKEALGPPSLGTKSPGSDAMRREARSQREFRARMRRCLRLLESLEDTSAKGRKQLAGECGLTAHQAQRHRRNWGQGRRVAPGRQRRTWDLCAGEVKGGTCLSSQAAGPRSVAPPVNSSAGQVTVAGEPSGDAPQRQSGQGRELAETSWGSIEAGARALAATLQDSQPWYAWLWKRTRGPGRLSGLRSAERVWGPREAEASCWSGPEGRGRTRKGVGEGEGECAGERERETGQVAGGAGEATQASVLMQYFSQPEVLLNVTLSFARCTAGLRVGSSREAKDVLTELLVNVDQPGEAREWVRQWRTLRYREGVSRAHDFVLVLFSHNVHENRAYNTLARLARGAALVLVQDDDLAPRNCAWLARIVAAMAHHPRLAAAGTLGGVRLWGSKGVQAYEGDRFGVDRATGEASSPTELVDVGPLAFRRSAWLSAGGLDESWGPLGQTGVISDWQLVLRQWLAGYWASHLAGSQEDGLYRDKAAHGWTHKNATTSSAFRLLNEKMNLQTLDKTFDELSYHHIEPEVERRMLQFIPGDPLGALS